MKKDFTMKKKNNQLKFYKIVFISVWEIILVISLLWNTYHHWVHMNEELRIQARVAYDKDMIYRYWNSRHGGVYIPVTEETQPDEYLAHIPERDVVTPSGKTLTLISPAHMTRQVHELSLKKEGIQGHITSLNPIKKENAPDDWERESLLLFKIGEKETSKFIIEDGKSYMRLMRPLEIKKECLTCHLVNNYQIDTIQAGISAKIPADKAEKDFAEYVLFVFLTHLVLIILGTSGIIYAMKRIQQSELSLDKAEKTISKKDSQLKKTLDDYKNFSYLISHDLRTPLRALDGFSLVLLEDYAHQLDYTAIDYLQRIRQASQKMGSIFDDLVTLSTLAQWKPFYSPLNLSEIVKYHFNYFKNKYPNRTSSLVIPEHININADKRLMNILIYNLMDNAWKFSSKREATLIESGTINNENNILEYFLKDNGIGIEQQYYNKIFETFYKLHTTDEYEGEGIGLSIVKKIIELHNGNVWVESKIDKGSTFYFTIG